MKEGTGVQSSSQKVHLTKTTKCDKMDMFLPMLELLANVITLR